MTAYIIDAVNRRCLYAWCQSLIRRQRHQITPSHLLTNHLPLIDNQWTGHRAEWLYKSYETYSDGRWGRWMANKEGRRSETRWHGRRMRGERWVIPRDKRGDGGRKCEECEADREEMRGAVDGWIMNDVISKNIRLQGNRPVWGYWGIWKARSVMVWCHQLRFGLDKYRFLKTDTHTKNLMYLIADVKDKAGHILCFSDCQPKQTKNDWMSWSH